jgi:hypothetical protein
MLRRTPTVKIDGKIQGGGSFVSQTPDWISEGALAAWPLQEESVAYLDEGSEMWDITYTPMNTRTHDLLSGVHLKRAIASFGTGTHVDARIVDEMSLAILFKSEGVAALGGIFCYTTDATTDALWGIGITAGLQPAFFDKRHGGVVAPSTISITSHAQTSVLFATRSSTGVVKLYLEGALIRTTSATAAPTVLGTEVITVGGRNLFSHAGLWDSELSEAEVARLTKTVKPWLDI